MDRIQAAEPELRQIAQPMEREQAILPEGSPAAPAAETEVLVLKEAGPEILQADRVRAERIRKIQS